MQKRKILVTGGSGFVGGFLIQGLLKDERNIVKAVYNSNFPGDILDFVGSNLTLTKVDIVGDDLKNLVSDIDIVYHLAGYSSVSSASSELALLNTINVLGTQRLVEACLESNVKQFIFVSSVAACECSIDSEIGELNGYPVTEYGKSKKRAEEVITNASKNMFEFTILRPTALFGENHEGSVFELVKKIHERRFVIFGSGRSYTNFLYIRDFVDLLLLVKDDQRAYGQIFIASDTPVQLDTFVNLIIDGLGLQLRIMRLPVSIGLIAALLCDILSVLLRRPFPLSRRRLRAMLYQKIYVNQKIKEKMAVNFKYGVKEGLLRSISYYREIGLL